MTSEELLWWSQLYNGDDGLRDTPTRGLIGEMLFKQLMPEDIADRLVKGTFQGTRTNKNQYDWILVKKNANLSNVKLLYGIPIGKISPPDVAAIIEVKYGDWIGEKVLTSESFALKQADRSCGKPWVYVTFGESKKVFDLFKSNKIALDNIKNNNGHYFCLSSGINTINDCSEVISGLSKVAYFLRNIGAGSNL